LCGNIVLTVLRCNVTCLCSKSTLLNTLAYRLDSNTKLEGELRLNGSPYGRTDLKQLAGYVMQDDLLNGNLTVWETIMYTAELRLPAKMPKEQKYLRARQVLRQVGLLHVTNVIVGDPTKKGISGGERKRLCVAQELITSPRLLFLDEPTSGLDSSTALALMNLLRRLSRNKERPCTVICSVHQPQYKIFRLLDAVILMKKGNILYQGATAQAVARFEELNLHCPKYTNPADYIMDLVTIKDDEDNSSFTHLPPKAAELLTSDANGETELDRILIKEQLLQKESIDLSLGSKTNGEVLSKAKTEMSRATWADQFRILCRRTFQEQLRLRNLIFYSILQSVVMAVLIGTAFLQIGTNQSSFAKRSPSLFFCCINQGMFGALMLINSFPAERLLSLRERQAGTYQVGAYFVAKQLVETLFLIPTPILFSPVVYFLIGYQYEAGKFFIFMAFMVLCTLAATSIALAISAVCRTVTLSVTVLPFVLEIMRLFGAFFLSPKISPSYFSWLDALSYVKYAYVGVSLNEMNGLKLKCTAAELKNGVCPITSGDYSINLLGLDFMPVHTITGCAFVLVAYILFFRFVAYLGLRYIK
jgi:ATP-binding cassette subfamily G (WHITE) protein 2